ncbi:MAG: Biopolymer transport protein ExbB [Chlamydiia bacterium]|nr:Biopolymer transport protein ExbB [Chlamydiia bacterium]
MPIAAMSTFTSAYMSADFFGKLIFLGLFALSFLCWITLVYKIWMIKQVKKSSVKFFNSIDKQKEAILNLSLDHLPQKPHKELPHPFAEIFSTLKGKTMVILEKNHFFIHKAESNVPLTSVYLSKADLEFVESHVQTTIVNQKEGLEKNLFVLPTITTLAPFLGLLGTVWGILVTFSGLQASGSFSSNSTVLGGLSTALVTTVLGLLIAIPSVISYSYLKQSIRGFSSEMEDFGHLLLSTVELQYRKVDVEA